MRRSPLTNPKLLRIQITARKSNHCWRARFVTQRFGTQDARKWKKKTDIGESVSNAGPRWVTSSDYYIFCAKKMTFTVFVPIAIVSVNIFQVAIGHVAASFVSVPKVKNTTNGVTKLSYSNFFLNSVTIQITVMVIPFLSEVLPPPNLVHKHEMQSEGQHGSAEQFNQNVIKQGVQPILICMPAFSVTRRAITKTEKKSQVTQTVIQATPKIQYSHLRILDSCNQMGIMTLGNAVSEEMLMFGRTKKDGKDLLDYALVSADAQVWILKHKSCFWRSRVFFRACSIKPRLGPPRLKPLSHRMHVAVRIDSWGSVANCFSPFWIAYFRVWVKSVLNRCASRSPTSRSSR